MQAPSRLPRNQTADAARGIAIVLMVLGHITGGLLGAKVLSARGIGPHFYACLYLFHMPAFMLLAGLFLESSLNRRGIAAFTADRIGTLYIPGILWTCVTFMSLIAFRPFVHTHPNPGMIIGALYSPKSEFWFLSTLLYLSIGYALLRRVEVPAVALLAASVAAFLIEPDTDRTLVSFFAWWGIWLFTGVVLRSAITGRLPALSVLRLLGLAMAGGAALAAGYEGNRSAIALLVGAAGGITVLLAFSALVCRAGGLRAIAGVLAACGRVSLEIYLVHSIFWVSARILLLRVFHIRQPVVLVPLLLLAGVSGSVAIALFAKRANLDWLFRVPLSKLLQRREPERSLAATA